MIFQFRSNWSGKSFCGNAYWNYPILIPNAHSGFVRGMLLGQPGKTHMILPWWKRISVLKTCNKLDLRYHHEICFLRDTGKENNFLSSSWHEMLFPVHQYRFEGLHAVGLLRIRYRLSLDAIYISWGCHLTHKPHHRFLIEKRRVFYCMKENYIVFLRFF